MPNNADFPRKLTPGILHDLPLRSEQADFHFEEFATTLARLIASKHTRTPLTIGVSGSWGAGKTTLLHRLRRMLAQTEVFYDKSKPELMDFVGKEEEPRKLFRPCRTVWFNAWKYAGEEALLVALMRVIVREMFADDFVAKSAAALLEPFTPRRNVIETVLSWFSIKVMDTGVTLTTGAPQETPFSEKSPLLDLFDDVFDRLMVAWVLHEILPNKAELNPDEGALVIFIDDLDRCLPAKTVQVLEAVKLFLDKPGCVFVLGADIAQVERAVTAHYEKTGVLGETASDYLEKIIQLRFPLPPIEVPKMQTFLSGIKAGDAQLITEEWGESWKLLITGAEVNPRKVKTIMNDLSLQWAMLVNSGQALGVHRGDFNAWQVLMRIAPRNFVTRVRDQLDDVELRYKFVMEAMEWAKGNQDMAANYREYDGSYRLKRVLKQMAFTETFNAERLDNFIHLTAPPVVEVVTPVAEVKKGAEGGEEAFLVKGIPRGDPGVTPREGVQTWGGLEFVRVPKGRFLMGSKEDNQMALDGEKPQHPVEIPHDYWIGRYPVTNEQFAEFVKAIKYVTLAEKEGGWNLKDKFEKGFDWKHPLGPKDNYEKKLNHPVVQISWDDVQGYCRWLNDLHKAALPQDYTFCLPTEAEWEKAARGEFGNEWPWGNAFDAAKCNSSEGQAGGTTPVGAYSPQGDSPYGAADMAGNVWEWTNSLFMGYPYALQDGREKPDDRAGRVLRGGAFDDNHGRVRAASRSWLYPDNRSHDYGFRVGVRPIFHSGL
jgi:formylglycine-generating enzyme required for sulfatase activity